MSTSFFIAQSIMASYPAYVDGKPPVVTLKEYDVAPWAGTTCVDKKNDGSYVIVVMEKPTTVVATVDENDKGTLDTIFKSAHVDFSDQLVNNKGNVPRKE